MRFGITAALEEAAKAMLRTELEYRRARIARHRNRDRTLAFQDPIPEVDRQAAQDAFDRLHHFRAAAVDAWVVGWSRHSRRWKTMKTPNRRTSPARRSPPKTTRRENT